MAVSSTTTSVSVTLSGALQSVSTGFVFFDSSDLKVYADGVLKTEGTHYSVAGGNGSTGTVTMLSGGPTTGAVVIIDRQIPETQLLDLTDGGPMAPSSVERAFDRLCYLVQQISSRLGRVVRLAVGSAAQSDLSLGTSASVIGSTGNGQVAVLTISQLIDLLNLPETVVDKPLKTWADDAARALAVPDFIGQLGMQVDLIANPRLDALYIGTALTAGSWSAADLDTAVINDGAVTTAKLADDSVTANKIAVSAVGSEQIATGAVGSDELAADAVGTAEIVDGAVTAAKLGTSAVESAKIQDGAVTAAKVASDAIVNASIVNATITPAKLKNTPYLLRAIQHLTSGTNATFTPGTDVRAFLVEVIGAGGGGGGIDGIATGTAASRAGGGGGYSRLLITDIAQTFKYTVGTGGAGGSAGDNSGSAGGTTVFYGGASGVTALLQATGGSGGAGDTGTNADAWNGLGGAGGVGSLGQLNLTGTPGGNRGRSSASIFTLSASGGAPFFGGGRLPAIASTGTAGANPGEGGSGCASKDSATNYAGGAGADGLIIITEYY